MFGRDDQTYATHIRIRKITKKISYACLALITTNYLVFIADEIYNRINGTFSHQLYYWTAFYIPNTCLFIDCMLLLISLVWICHSLRYDRQVMGIEKWMAIHTGLLVLTLGANIYNTVFYVKNPTNFLLSAQITFVCDTAIYLLMTFIMNQVNSK